MKIKIPKKWQKEIGTKEVETRDEAKVVFITKGNKTFQVQLINNKWIFKLYENSNLHPNKR